MLNDVGKGMIVDINKAQKSVVSYYRHWKASEILTAFKSRSCRVGPTDEKLVSKG